MITIDITKTSKETQRLNPHLTGSAPLPEATRPATSTCLIHHKASPMNRTETEFSAMLERSKRAGEIKDWKFEGIRLAWGTDPATGKSMRYLPDFCVTETNGSIRLIEVKGAHIWDRDKVRFRGARADWPQFTFELWQRSKDGNWTKLE